MARTAPVVAPIGIVNLMRLPVSTDIDLISVMLTLLMYACAIEHFYRGYDP